MMKKLHVIGFVWLIFIAFVSNAQTIIDFKNPNIHYMGRIPMDGEAARLTWTATSVVMNFNGTGAKAVLKDLTGFDYIMVVLDNQLIKRIQPGLTKAEYTLATGLKPGKHKVELFKSTEYDMGTILFYNFELEGNGKILPPPFYKHRIEFYGNSITCGYAVEDTTGQDRGTYEFENGFKSYANLTARHFNADYRSISKSGIGITISWFPYVMPDIYDHTVAMEPAKWDFSKYTPDIVVVNLFQNDSWLVEMPENAQFKAQFGSTKPTPEFITNAYSKFISGIRSKYPHAKIICALGNMDATKKGSAWPGYIKEAVTRLHDKNIYTCFFPYKNTPGHPNPQEQKAMANNLISFIHTTFNW
ncbi:SGNH/GDSL hydrolase family protein [Mucilaginibacter segetis]|uniref:Electron transporter RnfD n=1 Tax=Mucilaginibacter segetis TaxID=2793071 RepID=A0A934PX54_9SPHI|nr:SGNH/GDSL hydrolase family protein [Mucilaginibacter segetis]MBK0381091.1 electron transporter RnfD [Mucilaginibacter segetis]